MRGGEVNAVPRARPQDEAPRARVVHHVGDPLRGRGRVGQDGPRVRPGQQVRRVVHGKHGGVGPGELGGRVAVALAVEEVAAAQGGGARKEAAVVRVHVRAGDVEAREVVADGDEARGGKEGGGGESEEGEGGGRNQGD